MGDNSSPPEGDSSEAQDEQREDVDVDAVEAEYDDRTAPCAPTGHSGLMAVDLGNLLGIAFLSFLIGVAAEFGKRVARDLAWSLY